MIWHTLVTIIVCHIHREPVCPTTPLTRTAGGTANNVGATATLAGARRQDSKPPGMGAAAIIGGLLEANEEPENARLRPKQSNCLWLATNEEMEDADGLMALESEAVVVQKEMAGGESQEFKSHSFSSHILAGAASGSGLLVPHFEQKRASSERTLPQVHDCKHDCSISGSRSPTFAHTSASILSRSVGTSTVSLHGFLMRATDHDSLSQDFSERGEKSSTTDLASKASQPSSQRPAPRNSARSALLFESAASVSA